MRFTTVLVTLFFLWLFGLLGLALSIAGVVLVIYCLGLVVVGAEEVGATIIRVARYVARELRK